MEGWGVIEGLGGIVEIHVVMLLRLRIEDEVLVDKVKYYLPRVRNCSFTDRPIPISS